MLSSRIGRSLAATAGLLALLGGLALSSPSAGAGRDQQPTPTAGPDDRARGMVWDGFEPGRPGTPCEGAFEVRGRSGAVLCSHGPDPAPPGVDVREGRTDAEVAADLAGAEAASADGLNPDGIACIGDGATGYRVQALYVVPTDRTNRASTVVPTIRATYAPRVESQFARSAAETGGEAHVRFVTSATAAGCELDVQVVTVPSTADDSFSATADALRSAGYDRSDRKYLVWMDSNVVCGVGSVYGDSRPTQDNFNNGYAAQYARADSGCWNYAEAHELMHNLGGVQPNAPNATPNFHCTDEPDDMCYDDDGSGPVVTRSVCTGRDGTLFDCNHDDYFLAGTPAADTYLATHWNTYDSRWIHRGALAPVTPTNAAPTVSVTAPASATTGQAVALDGSVADDGLPSGSAVTQQWTASGPGTVSFGSPTAVDTPATFPVPGTYTVTLTATDGSLSASASATVQVSAPTSTTSETFTGTFSTRVRSITHPFTSAPGTVSATIRTSGSKMTATLYDAAGVRIASRSASGTFTISGTSAGTGSHRLVVQGKSGTYTATVTHPS